MLMSILQTRYQIHSCEVSAVDFAADGDTIVSGDADGRVILWSHVTGFKLAVWTLHSAAIRTLAFNSGGYFGMGAGPAIQMKFAMLVTLFGTWLLGTLSLNTYWALLTYLGSGAPVMLLTYTNICVACLQNVPWSLSAMQQA